MCCVFFLLYFYYSNYFYGIYNKFLKVISFINFGISSLWGLLFLGVVILEGSLFLGSKKCYIKMV